MLKKIIFFVLSSFIVFAATIYYRLGAYKNVDISVEKLPPMHLLYKEHYGAYHKINTVISEVESWAVSHNVPCKKTFGEYLDDPRLVDERRLRSNGGCVLEIIPAEKTPFAIKTIESARYVVAHFTGAPSIGPLKVYPKVEEYFKSNRINMPTTVIEIYDVQNQSLPKTDYLFLWPE